MKIDLHTHSTASDGLLSPAQLVAAARARGIGTLALTDHDTTDGLAEVEAAGREQGVEVIPGVEISTDEGAFEVHILGYFVDAAEDALQAFLLRMQTGRLERARRMVERLAALGAPVEWGRVREIAEGPSVGRPHIARALVEAGFVGSIQEAFERFLGRSGPAYVPRMKLTPEEAVQTIRRAGAVPVLAHPGWAASGPVLDRVPALVEHGLCGIEAYYPDHTPAIIRACLALARRYDLVVTGGTDFHGGGVATRVPLGSVAVPPETVPALRSRWASLHSRGGRGAGAAAGELPA